MTRARKGADIGVAVTALPVSDEPVGFDAVAFRVDSLQQDRNIRIRHDVQRGQLINALGAAGVDPGAGVFASDFDASIRLAETIWTDQLGAEDSTDLASDFADLRSAGIDGIEPSE